MGGREFTIHVDNPDGSGLVAIGPDDEIPDWARKLVDKRHLSGPLAAADDGEPFDPSDHTVDEVNEYLSGDGVDEDEVARVLAAEGAEEGKQRAGILNGPHAAA